MEPIRVVVQGALGKVGREVVAAVSRDPATKLVGAIDIKASGDALHLPDSSETVPLSKDTDALLSAVKADVIVDFTVAKACFASVPVVTKHKVNMVIGTTGFSEDNLKEMDRLARENGVGIVVAPNFALGAVVMIHLAKIAARYFDHAEVIELHHDQKVDAPSGTALSTARAMAKAKGKAFINGPGENFDSRGQCVEGISVHSVRLPGLMAHQEVLFGASGQTLSIRHDTINRECYMPGVLAAVKEVGKHKGLVFGLDTLLGL